jgi:hypothetical protein
MSIRRSKRRRRERLTNKNEEGFFWLLLILQPASFAEPFGLVAEPLMEDEAYGAVPREDGCEQVSATMEVRR